jgi:aminopeptidase N
MLLRRALLAVGGLVAVCGVMGAQRLPGGVRPEHYSLTITPDLAQARFAGSETIGVVLDAPTDTITLNAAEIEFGAVRAYAGIAQKTGTEIVSFAENDASGGIRPAVGSSAPVQSAVVTLDAAKQQATFTFQQLLPAGPVRLDIAYSGIINEKLRGFYLSRTRLRRYGVTQFEATDARRAFPSFDEPALKATFDVRLVLDAGDTGISNTKMISDVPGPVAGKHTIAFATTPKMSTYLVAWLVGDFKCSEGKQDGVPIRACSTPDKVDQTKFALEAAKWDLSYYDRYFGIKYPMAKLDLVAIPDFEAGAMENFGCITFRETEMLVDRKNGELEAKKEVATTVAHEIAHQWFGDLVTPAWWDDIWLNEGFATWMESKASAQWQPRWNYPEEVALEKDVTMDEDAGKTTRAIRTRAETPQQIDELFDDIAYGKAGSVIAMVENWVGEDAFRKGVQAYLAAHAYGNATAEDFWSTETQVSGLPVDKVMRSFVDQPGVPLVMLGGGSVPVTQQRFLLAASAAQPEQDEQWTIPLCFTGAPCRLLQPGVSMQPPSTTTSATFPYANSGDLGYYRTAYAPAELKQVEASVEAGLSAPERIGLLGDQWALVRAGRSPVGDFLNLVLTVKQDASARVLGVALGKLATVEMKIASDDERTRLDAIVRRELGPVYEALGTAKHASVEQSQLRQELFEELGRAKDPAVLAEADAITRQLFARKKSSDPMIADAAVAVAVASAKGDAAMYDGLMRVADKTTDPDLKAAALNALTRFETPELVARTLDYAVSDAVRSQDSWTLIVQLLEQRETQDQAWEFVDKHWPEIIAKGSVMSGARIVEAAGSFCTTAKRDAVASFFHEHPAGTSERILRKSLGKIDECIQLRAEQEPELRRWLDSQPNGLGRD